MKNNNFCACEQVKSSQVRPSIFKTLERVKEQVEFWCFERTTENARGERFKHTDPIYEELCLIIAEIYVMNPDTAIKVAGAENSAFIVQEVFGRLQHEHIETVVGNFQRVSYTVNNKKAYLRTALYNAVFECESTVTNQIATDMPGFYDRGRGDK